MTNAFAGGALRRLRATERASSGVLVPHPGVLYSVRYAGQTTGGAEAVAILRDQAAYDPLDHTEVLLATQTSSELGPDDWPQTGLAIPFERGLTVECLGAQGILTVMWDVV